MTHRVIDLLDFTLDADQALIGPLDRRGLSEAGCPNGWPLRPQRRTIDLRAGDKILCEGRWHWFSESKAIASPDDAGGYIHRVVEDVQRIASGSGEQAVLRRRERHESPQKTPYAGVAAIRIPNSPCVSHDDAPNAGSQATIAVVDAVSDLFGCHCACFERDKLIRHRPRSRIVPPRGNRTADMGARGLRSPWSLVVIVCLAFCGQRAASGGTVQVALFTGFNAGANAGMDVLNEFLAASAVNDYTGMVFEWTQRENAFDWIQQHAEERTTLVVIGHSFGGNSALQLANNYLKPAGVAVDLTIQIDSVENFYTGWNNVLPSNVEAGINYFQHATGFLEPQGEDYVQGAQNYNVEVLFNDTSITHTSIDNDPRLHSRIVQDILENLNQPTADFDGDGLIDGADFLKWQRGESPRGGSADDLALWQSQYGAGGPASASVAVPEPASATLVAIVVGFAAIVGRNRAKIYPRRSGDSLARR
ncbi:MAG: hypothetical protein KDA44_17865 [Planctomycetales bacterium]|nr:hypothetical protein [Planctomycetales bacterium]